MAAKLISIIIPLYNEEDNIPLLYKKLKSIVNFMDYDFEIIAVDDGSRDGSFHELKKIEKKDSDFKIIQFTRNFGKEMATTAGIQYCSGDACIIMDSDLQHPPENIPIFLEKWEKGAEVVVGIRNKSRKRPLRNLSSYLYCKIMNMISETKFVQGDTDFRLLDRVVIDEFKKFSEKTRITRGLINWLGFRKEFVHFEVPERANGKVQYGLIKRIRLAFYSTVSMSLFPLRIAGYIGIFITSMSALAAIFIIVERYVLKDPLGLNFSGLSVLGFINMLLVGVILMCLGLIALYIENIHKETLNRPLYVVRYQNKKGSVENSEKK
ncbi:glycosyltransferase [candidate division WS5 bacterium]|uniref:Glycosyltransferase n=1 Tax=candidate division WS5 bacterium TaxID=2093353 RepID=A0A419DBQ6_9BACT|nr:MAG: glycosyltransferase [candidate division WS5 bacterium]